MFRTAIATIAATAMVPQATAQADSRKLSAQPVGQWAVIQVGEQKTSHCVMGVRSNAAAPEAGKPQFMITADDQFAILRVRAAEWAFTGGRDITVTLVANGQERQPAAAVRGTDLIDIAVGVEPERINELAAAGYLEIRTEGTSIRLPLDGLVEALPAYRDCLAGIGQPLKPQVYASAVQ